MPQSVTHRTLMKVVTHAYLRTCSQAQLWQDCYAAMCAPLDSLTRKVEAQRSEVRQLIDDNLPKQMSVISQQQPTQRQALPHNFQDKIKLICSKFNAQIKNIKNISCVLDEILGIYKQQLQSIAMDLKTSQQKNSKLKLEVRRLKTAQPTPQQSKQPLERQNWKHLSQKIQLLKKRIQGFESQIHQKDQIIRSLSKEQQKQCVLSQQIRKLKQMNTTLRGEKVLQSNQLSTLRKQIEAKCTLASTQQLQIKKLKMEVENVASTVKWQSAVVQDLRSSYGKSVHCTVRESLAKTTHLESLNRILLTAINQQENCMGRINDTTAQIEQRIGKGKQKYEKRIGQLESILEEKNECIIRLKSGGSNYQQDMIKLLNKKIMERDQEIKRLRV